jgi:hypothetical protein
MIYLVSCQKDTIVPDPVPPPPPPPRELQVWLHHVDDTLKSKQFQNSYSGFELDVHFDTLVHTFIVKHDFSETSTLTLSAWLSALNDPRSLGFWLDFKNLAEENKMAALAELIRLRNLFNLNQHIIIVESNSSSSLPPFDTLNFRISYYIPPFNPASLNAEEELSYRDFIDDAVSTDGIRTISGYSIQHSFMQKWFPGMNKLLWYLDTSDPVMKESVITEIRKDPTVEVLLVTEDYPLSYHINYPLGYK